VIDFTYGKDAFDQNGDSSYTENRGVVLGDIFHSTPIAVGQPTVSHQFEDGYKVFQTTYNDRDRVLYAGANDGMLHAFHAGDFHTGDDLATPEMEDGYYDYGTGTELFGYVPSFLLDKLKFLSHNIPRTVYYVDGSPAAAEAWLGDGSGSDITKVTSEWATVLVSGLREGGAGYTALDITDPDADAFDAHGPYPKLLWEFDHAKLGDSWSEPIITRVRMVGNSGTGDHCGPPNGEGDCREQWVAIFAGGYDSSADPNHFMYDGDPTSDGWTDKGKAIYMVALDSGALLASVEFDASGVSGPAGMKYAIPSTPAVLDADFDGFADLIYVGDLGGQVWKWDIAEAGEDTVGDSLIDNWEAGVFFYSAPETLDSGIVRYRSFFYPPAAAYDKGRLIVTIGSGEREELRYAGDEDEDDNNRFFVIQDLFPSGTHAFDTLLTESDLTDATLTATDEDRSDSGYYFTVSDGEKFVTNTVIFAGYVVVATYDPDAGTGDECTTAGGEASLYIFDLGTGQGIFVSTTSPGDPRVERRTSLGGGLPSSPKVSIASDQGDDRIYIKTSTGQVISLDLDLRTEPPDSVYWRQVY
jgi:type IV pilus assembly protein PilY1